MSSKFLQTQYTQIPELSKVEIISGFNLSGSPVFNQLTTLELLSEGQYLSFWKKYFLSLIGNWYLQLFDESYGQYTSQLNTLLTYTGLKNIERQPDSALIKLTKAIHGMLRPKKLGVEFSTSQFGAPMITPQIEFHQLSDSNKPDPETHSDEEYLTILNKALAENDITVWVLLDRLDEAFVGYPQFEIPILRALMRTYLDLFAYDRIGVKLFVRRDLFNKIVKDGFVNLTHINARKTEILWQKEDLLSLLCKRITGSIEFAQAIRIRNENDMAIIDKVFPIRIGSGDRAPTTWNWILSRLKDGNGVIAPRNLIELLILAKDEQNRKENRSPRYYFPEQPLIEYESIVRALARLSVNRVQDTLLAEVSRDMAALISGFRGNKQEYTDESISHIFGVGIQKAQEFASSLQDIGFLENSGKNYKIAPIYRDGLNIQPGKIKSK